MRIIVTGGAGFIGFHLIERLLKEHEVVCIDDLSTGSEDNIRPFLRNKRFTFQRKDIQWNGIGLADRIYNLACPASPKHYQADPTRTMRTCVGGLWNVCEAARRYGARVLQASTSEVYGDPDVHPQTEDYCGNVNTVGPRGCYDEGKRAAEALLYDYARQYGVDVRCARIFNTYGPRMQEDDGRAIPTFITQAKAGVPITLHGDGLQTRSFCYVDDLVEGLITLMESDETRPVNFGNPEEMSLYYIVNLIRQAMDSTSIVVNHDRPQDDPERRQPDISRAKALGWEPKISFDEGLKRTIAYFTQKLDRTTRAA